MKYRKIYVTPAMVNNVLLELEDDIMGPSLYGSSKITSSGADVKTWDTEEEGFNSIWE